MKYRFVKLTKICGVAVLAFAAVHIAVAVYLMCNMNAVAGGAQQPAGFIGSVISGAVNVLAALIAVVCLCAGIYYIVMGVLTLLFCRSGARKKISFAATVTAGVELPAQIWLFMSPLKTCLAQGRYAGAAFMICFIAATAAVFGLTLAVAVCAAKKAPAPPPPPVEEKPKRKLFKKKEEPAPPPPPVEEKPKRKLFKKKEEPAPPPPVEEKPKRKLFKKKEEPAPPPPVEEKPKRKLFKKKGD